MNLQFNQLSSSSIFMIFSVEMSLVITTIQLLKIFLRFFFLLLKIIQGTNNTIFIYLLKKKKKKKPPDRTGFKKIVASHLIQLSQNSQTHPNSKPQKVPFSIFHFPLCESGKRNQNFPKYVKSEPRKWSLHLHLHLHLLLLLVVSSTGTGWNFRGM